MMKTIVECNTFVSHFFEAQMKSPIEAALLLGNLLIFKDHASDTHKKLVDHVLAKIKEKMNRSDVVAFWDAINKKIKTDSFIMDEKTIQALNKVRLSMVCDIEFIKKLPFTKIVGFGQNVNQYRIAMIALVRRHLYYENLSDPFATTFNYDLLLNAGVEQNYQYLSEFIKQCKSLPVNSLISLGRLHKVIAQLLLIDLYNTDAYFEISLAFAKLYPQMRTNIALQWKQLLANYPLVKENVNELNKCLRQASIFPEFSYINTSSRALRYPQRTEIQVRPNLIDFYLKCLGISSTIMTLPRLLNHTSHIATFGAALWSGVGVYPAAAGVCTSAVPVIVPLAAYGAITWMANNKFKRTSRAPSQNSVDSFEKTRSVKTLLL